MREEFNILYDLLIKYHVATPNEILLVCQINGRSVETLEDILYAKTGYKNIRTYTRMCASGFIDYEIIN